MYLMMYTSFSTSVKANNFRDGCVAFIHRQPSVDEEDKSFYRVHTAFNRLSEVSDIIPIAHSHASDLKMGY